MKTTIKAVDVNWNYALGGFGSLFVHRNNGVRQYRIENDDLTRYQRAVRLLNAFVERNMK